MTIVWCEEHNAQQTGIYAGGYDSFCWKRARHPIDSSEDRCRMVEKRLVPLDVVVLDRAEWDAFVDSQTFPI